jgi:O-antigen/teichoic acid export membrane protein
VKIHSKFLRDTTSLQLAGLLSSVLQIASVILVAFLLGSEGQGLFVSAGVLHAFGHCLLNVGVGQTAASQISANSARGREGKIATWIAFLLKVQLMFATWIIVVGFLFFPWLGENLLESEQIGIWASWFCIGSLLDVPRDVVRIALQGTRRMRSLGRVENGQELVRFFLIASGALIAGGPEGAVIGSLIASAFGSLLALEIYRSASREDGAEKNGATLPRLWEVLRQMPATPIRKGLRQGVRIAAFKNLHTMIFLVLPKLTVQALAGSSWVAYYHVAQRLTSLPQILSIAVSRNSLPAMGEMAGKRDSAGFRKMFATTTLGSGLAITSAVWTLVLLVPFVIDKAFAPDYLQPVMQLAVVLAIGESASGFAVCLEAFFISANRLRALFLFSLLGFATAIPLAVWLIANVEYTGAAWGVVTLRVFNLLQIVYAIRFLWGHGPRDYWASDAQRA